MKKQAFFVGLLLFLFGSLRPSEINYDKDTTELYLTLRLVTDEQLEKIATTCPNLEKLVLDKSTGFTYAGVQEILNNCKNLNCLSLFDCKIDFEKITVVELKKLESLSLSYSSITDEGLQNIVKNGLTAWYLDLDTTDIRGEEIDWDKLNNLTNLILNSSKITDNGLEKISTACKNLKTLWIPYTNITDKGVQYILNSSAEIVKLNLSGCENIDFTKLDWSKLNNFETLYLDGPAVTEAGLQKILICPNLNYLSLTGCTNLRKEWQRNFDGKEEIQKLREQFSPFPDFACALATIL